MADLSNLVAIESSGLEFSDNEVAFPRMDATQFFAEELQGSVKIRYLCLNFYVIIVFHQKSPLLSELLRLFEQILFREGLAEAVGLEP